ncbi:putative bifunctional diguanylate cyclase/phosphodiesterase [Glacieibacterium megasporae]|uniref:putative bifunctional diguanylate cyclase/phosphodiesterase n=1 Tax=Glacieibacterium megasporae TaxID=2835787 RepID=UPI001C1E52E2|nr:EAL domain-containing protein [Polymorphobacter megasporae]UAJ09670.1 EAL domain-containing protein [Polymorphobacter megasporae]
MPLTRLQEKARLAALYKYDVLDTPAEASFDRISRAAAEICSTPMALVSLVDDDRQWFKSNIGVTVSETPRAVSFCTHTVDRGELLVVPDASVDPLFFDSPFVAGEMSLRFYAGAPLTTPDGHCIGALCVLHTEKRDEGLSPIQAQMLEALAAQVVVELELRRCVAQLQWSAHHDALTGLGNRVYFHKQLDALLARQIGRDPPARVALALLDLDHFKQVNDAYGHDAGDALLKVVAARLDDFLMPDEMAARLGGDEFVLILPNCGSDFLVERRLAQLIEKLREPYVFEGRQLDVSASIGVACSPRAGRDSKTLLKHADIAMYRAKAAGRSVVWMYRRALGDDVERRVEIFNVVRAAIRSGDIFPYYQAQFDLETGAIIGCEALARLRDSTGKIRLPAEIEEAFDDFDLGVGIGVCILRRVVKDIRGWIDQGIDVGHVSINASAAELRRVDYADAMLNTLAEAGVPPAYLQVEVTESVFLGRGSERVEETLNALNAAGIAIALDDFGTGFASLSHLKRFPVDIIKIDRSFVSNVEDNDDDATIVAAVIGLARNLGMKIVAEGVETAGQAGILRGLGCRVVQGNHFSRPVTADALTRMLEADTAVDAARS